MLGSAFLAQISGQSACTSCCCEDTPSSRLPAATPGCQDTLLFTPAASQTADSHAASHEMPPPSFMEPQAPPANAAPVCRYFDFVNFNTSGYRPYLTTLYAVILGCLRKTVSRILVLIVSMGFGVVVPYLGAVQQKVITLATEPTLGRSSVSHESGKTG